MKESDLQQGIYRNSLEHHGRLLKNLHKLRQNSAFCDVEVSAGDGFTLKVGFKYSQRQFLLTFKCLALIFHSLNIQLIEFLFAIFRLTGSFCRPARLISKLCSAEALLRNTNPVLSFIPSPATFSKFSSTSFTAVR